MWTKGKPTQCLRVQHLGGGGRALLAGALGEAGQWPYHRPGQRDDMPQCRTLCARGAGTVTQGLRAKDGFSGFRVGK